MSDPIAAKYVRPFRMGRELINGTNRWCLWMLGVEPSEIKSSAFLRSGGCGEGNPSCKQESGDARQGDDRLAVR